MTSMIAAFTALTVALAPPSSVATACAASDLRCLGAAYAQDADAATEPGVVAQHLAAASSAYLGLFRETGEPRHLCMARQLATRGLTLGRLRVPLTKYHDEANAELARIGATCTPAPRKRSRAASTPAATTPAATTPALQRDPTPTMPAEPPVATPSSSTSPPTTQPADPLIKKELILFADEPPAPQPDPLLPLRARPAVAPPRPGLGLLIAGGMTLGAAVALGGAAGYAAFRRDDLVRAGDEIRDETAAQGYADPATAAAWPKMEAEAQHWHRVMLGAAISSGLVGALALGLLAGGAHRRRSTPNLSLHPRGVLFVARF